MSQKVLLGRYKGVAIRDTFEITLPEEGKDGYPRAQCKLRVISDDRGDTKDAGIEFRWSGSLSENEFTYQSGDRAGQTGTPAAITIEAMRTLGWTGNDITDPVGLGDVIVDIVITQKPGSKFAEVAVYTPRTPRPTLRKEDMAQFAKRFKAVAVAAKPAPIVEANRAPAVLPPARLSDRDAEFPPADSGAL